MISPKYKLWYLLQEQDLSLFLFLKNFGLGGGGRWKEEKSNNSVSIMTNFRMQYSIHLAQYLGD